MKITNVEIMMSSERNQLIADSDAIMPRFIHA